MTRPIPPIPDEGVEVDAARWLARLHADDLSAAEQNSFKEWLGACPAHEDAFAEFSEIWEVAGSLPRELIVKSSPPNAVSRRREFLAAAVTLLAVGGAFAVLSKAQAVVYETAVGQQKKVILEDGTQLFLDTDTRLVASFSKDRRVVELERGRVNFKPANERVRPFIVIAGSQKIVSNQASFDVRYEGDQVSVVLIQGQAAFDVNSLAESGRALGVGERLVLSPKHLIKIDKPNLGPLVAWQKGQAILNEESLGDVVTEMNRYSQVKLEVRDPEIVGLRVSGVYKVGDNAAFAYSIARLLPIRVLIGHGQVYLLRDDKRWRDG